MPLAAIKVWDLWVRVGHWFLVVTVGGAWWTRHGGDALHEWLGYGALGVVAIRCVWGFVGSSRARFRDFVRSPRAVMRYTSDLVAHREARYAGHNPLGGYMVVALLATVALTGFTGWLYTTDRFWGIAWVGNSHKLLSDLLLFLIALHVLGVAFTSYRERTNLVAAMIHGRKRSP